MALGLNKIIIANTAANTAGSYPQPVTGNVASLLYGGATGNLSAVGGGNATSMINAVYIPTGLYWLPATGNLTIEINNYNPNTSTNAWTIIMGNNTGGMIVSDGFNVRANAISGTVNVTLFTVNGGAPVSGTFLS